MTPEEIILKDSQVASLPTIFYEVMEAVDDPDSTFADISALISHDVGLSGRLLKIVNSPFYGFPQKIETISHAMNIVGTEQLCQMVLATKVMSQFYGIPEDLITMDSFWSHSIATGLASQGIAKILEEPNRERIYVAGMIHEIGSLLLYKHFAVQSREALSRCNEWGQNLVDAEWDLFGFDHTDVGRALAVEWKLPPQCWWNALHFIINH